MHLFADFEAIYNQYIIAAAFVSHDGSFEEHWLMKPYSKFTRLEGNYATLLPYSNEDLVAAPLLQSCQSRFEDIIKSASTIWFYDKADLTFFSNSYKGSSHLIQLFTDRYADAKVLVEEILSPIYIQNQNNGEMVHIRNCLNYIESHDLNTRREWSIYNQMQKAINTARKTFMANTDYYHSLNNWAEEAGFFTAEVKYRSIVQIQRKLDGFAASLHPKSLLSRNELKDIRFIRSYFMYLYTLSEVKNSAITAFTTTLDRILAVSREQTLLHNISVESVQKVINDYHMPLSILNLCDEAGFEYEASLDYLSRSIGLKSAAVLLLTPQEMEIEGVHHNALYDSKLLRLVCLACFERIKKLKPFLSSDYSSSAGGLPDDN